MEKISDKVSKSFDDKTISCMFGLEWIIGATQDNDYDRRNRPKPSCILLFTAVHGV